MPHVATGIGSMPGTDYGGSLRTVLGEIGDFPHVVELPERGPAATMIGRSLAVVAGLGADLQPAGWRLAAPEGLDQRRSRSLLARDLDALEELADRHRGRFKLQLAGPGTLAATVELPRGGKVLADPGARRDLTQALAEGVGVHVQDVRRRLPAADVVVQLDEPALPAVLAGAVPTASGLYRHRSVPRAEVAASLDEVLVAATEAGAQTAVHCCAAGVPFDVLAQTSARSLSCDATLLPSTAYDAAAAWHDSGRALWLGVVPASDPGTDLTDADLTRSVLELWSRLGYPDPEAIPETTVTPTCGLAGASVPWARQALEMCARTARNLSVEQGRMTP